jgi:hypothetical protein
VSLLYTVEGGVLNKYRLEEKKAELAVKAEEAVSKTFKLFIYGSCEDLEHSEKADRVEACRLSRTIALSVS